MVTTLERNPSQHGGANLHMGGPPHIYNISIPYKTLFSKLDTSHMKLSVCIK